MDEDFIGVLRLVDLETDHPDDAQCLIGITEPCETEAQALDQSCDLALEYFMSIEHSGDNDWEFALGSDLIEIRLNLVHPGRVVALPNAHEYIAKAHDGKILFEQI